ncbi:MAG: response regulator [Fibrobacteria bacterium]|nr:response regulator [Fibrobacteria bacterium]
MSTQTIKILIVEDEVISQKVLANFLRPYGECSFASNGVEGFEKFLTAHQKGVSYDLLCLDIMMPIQNGLATLKQIRDWEKRNNIADQQIAKCIMVTAIDNEKNRTKALEQNCDGYITKPIKIQELIKKLEELGFSK